MNAAVELVGTVDHGKRPALAHVDAIGVIDRLRIVDVSREAGQWAALIRRHGVAPGESVVVLAERDRHWRSALLGVLEAGAVAVPCPATAPPATIQAITFDAGAPAILSARPRPDLAELSMPRVLCPDDFEQWSTAQAAERMPHRSFANDLALILYAHDESGLHAAEHTHASLLSQAVAAERWLGVRERQCVWCTAADGSHESIWLLLAAWHLGAEILSVEGEPGVRDALELIEQFAPAAVWFSDAEYATLAAAEVPPWIDLGRVQLALTSDEPGDGADAFAERFATTVAPVFSSAETGVVDAVAAEHVAEPLHPEPEEADAYERDALRAEDSAEEEHGHAESGPTRQTDEDLRAADAETDALAADVIAGISKYGVTGRSACAPEGERPPGPPGPDERRLAD